MSHDLTVVKTNCLLPQTFEQAERYAEKIANSSLCPSAFKGKAGDVFIAIQMGSEVGLSPMQALQNIAVINGRPSMWGDAALALVRVHPHCKSIREWMEGSIKDGTAVAYCAVVRKGQQEEIRSFSVQQAKTASLWGKSGPWTQYPERMLQMRARGFALRDIFADALRGLHIAEEAQDIIEVVAETPAYNRTPGLPISQSYVANAETLENNINLIKNASNIDELKKIYLEALGEAKGDKEAVNKITKEKNDRYKALKKPSEIEVKTESNEEFLKQYDETN